MQTLVVTQLRRHQPLISQPQSSFRELVANQISNVSSGGGQNLQLFQSCYNNVIWHKSYGYNL